jgi:cell division septum initiation protein DivIVA
MPDQSSAAREHALMQEITEPLATLPDDAVPIAADAEFPTALRGYDRLSVDAYVKRTTQLVAELQARSSPQAAIRRALERVGEEVSGILQRAHDTAEQITAQSRREAEDRLEVARQESSRIITDAQARLKDLDVDTDRIWAERDRIVEDARDLARQLSELADVAAARFPPAEDSGNAIAVDETLPLGASNPAGQAPAQFDDETEHDRSEHDNGEYDDVESADARGVEARGGGERDDDPGLFETVEFTSRDVEAFEAGEKRAPEPEPEPEAEPEPGQTERPTGRHDEPEPA